MMKRERNFVYCPSFAGAPEDANVFVTSSTLRTSYTACTTCLFKFVAMPLKPDTNKERSIIRGRVLSGEMNTTTYRYS